MNGRAHKGVSRRQIGAALGALVASFALPCGAPFGQVVEGAAPVSFAKNQRLDGWIRIGRNGVVSVFTGKAELGQGISTALAQIAADELDVAIKAIQMIGPDTRHGPDEGYTYGSQSIEQSGAAIRAAAAQAREVLLEAASKELGVAAALLEVTDGVISAPNGGRISYGELAEKQPDMLRQAVGNATRPKPAARARLVGAPVPRLDFLGKFTAQAAYIQDMRLPEMLFARVARPPRSGAKLLAVDQAAVRAMPGVVAVVVDGSFLGVVAEREEQAIAARRALLGQARWSNDGPRLPDKAHLTDELKRFAREDHLVDRRGPLDPTPGTLRRLEATYSRPFLSQATIGPSCALAQFKDGHMTVWSHTQGTYPLRGDLATVLKLPASDVDVVHVPSAGCYGHNGADDAAADAALLARAVDGRPVKLQWMRDDEFGWAPISPAMVMQAQASLSPDGMIVDWRYELWSNSHTTRPGQSGGVNLLASWYLEEPQHISPPLVIPQPYGNGDRNAVPVYDLPRREIVNHLLTEMPIRTGSLRTLGAQANIFAIECFMDELALAAKHDPIEFRLAHLADPRGRAVIEAVAKHSGWVPEQRGDGRHGRGFAYVRYKNISTYAAVGVDVAVDPSSGKIDILRAIAAVDVGRIINPSGVRSQIEGGLVQGLSWALMEEVTFDERHITSLDWASYPIMTFAEVPPIEVILLDRPDQPSLGAGEGSVGPASAALANAVANATGRRVRDLPLSPSKVRG